MSVQGVIEFYIEIAASRRGGIHVSVYMHVNVCTMIVQTSTACNPRQFCGSDYSPCAGFLANGEL